VFASKTPVVIAVNKIDRLSPAAIGASIERIAELGDFAALVPISAKRRDGIDRIGDELLLHAPEGPALYPVNATSGDPVRLRIGELVREAALNRTHEEVPHAVAVLVEEYTPATRRHAARVTCSLLCDHESQKGILVGKNGAMIRQIGADARPGIERLLGAKVMLELTVRVRRGWRDDDRVLDQLG
jgi:GTP-binding protein Era